jgi:hypothetical protein
MKNFYPFLFILLSPIYSQAQSGVAYFDGNNIKALISPVGNHFWDYQSRQMFIPKDSTTGTIFTFSTWLGGKSDDTLYLAAERYRQNGADYLPGPIGEPTTYEPSEYAKWDRVWKITREEVTNWINDPENVAVPQSVLDWPAHGNPDDGQAENLAPFHDQNGDGQYDPVNDLDYPIFKGDQAVYFIFHDGWIHTSSGGRSLNVEIHGMAYGFNCPEDTALNHTLFMEYNMINRSSKPYEDCYFGMWSDFDLGSAQDDYIGSDPMRNLFFAYNGDNLDNDEYGTNTPAQGIRILDGIEMDNDDLDNIPSLSHLGNWNGFNMLDGTTDNEKLGLGHFLYHNNSFGPTSSPTIANDYYNFMSGHWKDDTPVTYGGNGHDPLNANAIPARFMFTDSSDTDFYSTYGIDTMQNTSWHELSAGNFPADRRGMGSTGPFTFESNSSKSITFAFVFAQKMNDRLGAVDKMKAYSDHIQEVYIARETACGPFDLEFPVGQEELQKSAIKVFPNPTQGLVNVDGLASSAQVSIIGIDGTTILSQAIQKNGAIDISKLANGTYILAISNDETTFHQSIIKM